MVSTDGTRETYDGSFARFVPESECNELRKEKNGSARKLRRGRDKTR